MNENGFFRFVNRFNSIALMLLLIAGLGTFTYVNLLSNEWENKRAVKIDNNAEESVELILGSIEGVAGTDSSYVSLRERDSGTSFSSGGAYGALRNVLFVKGQDINSTWLLTSNKYLIDQMHALKVGGYSSKEPVMAFLYSIVYKDTNHNSKFDKNDKLAISLSKPDGTGLKTLLSDIDSLIDYKVSEDGAEISLMYQVNESVFIEKISVADFSSIAKKQLLQVTKA
ncbi:hypothetical protein [Shewanella sedimentimangrovi]|uniref:Transmembrane protein n=1 Tax=Shewanella sedimentimangrovi TaxID=2814293 RepID=A0ABX7QWJ0_9GAMM|nr:hypothetical protein [Shewanella sedimentimangrovi]QSX35614.1 hypothetical protein JYB85_09415 [Shewanella sedimentimangrovi]